MKELDVFVVVVGIFYVLAVMLLSNHFWSRSMLIRMAPIFAPASYEWILIVLKIRDVSYLTISRFGEMVLLGFIFFVAFIFARYEGQRSKKNSKEP